MDKAVFKALLRDAGLPTPRAVVLHGPGDAARAGQPLSLLVLDEIFGSLDDARREHVLDLLRALEGRFPQVVLITHIEGVREAVDRVLRVRFDEATGAAVVEEERAALALDGGGDADVAA